jgi:predicted N-acetyltransferase YhbS
MLEMHDQKAWHFVAVESDAVIGCVVLNPLTPENQCNSQMAVETDQQGKGIGKLLVKELLSFVMLTELKKWFAMRETMPFLLFEFGVRNL